MAWNLHAIEQTQSLERRRVDGVGRLNLISTQAAGAEGEAPAPAPGELRSIHASLDGVNNHNVMLFDLNSCALENFECHYNKFCAQQDLKPFLKEELQAELASRFDCKFKRVRSSA